MMGPLGSSGYSKSPRVKEWVSCTSVQSCPLQHPAGVAMVTSCNLAFTHRNRLALSLQGQMHLLNALIVHGSPSQRGVFRTRHELVPVPSGPASSGAVGGGAEPGGKGEESKFMEGRLKCSCF